MDERRQEVEIIHHFSHEHPMRRIPNITEEETFSRYYCYGCGRDFLPGDAAYGCNVISCYLAPSLHKECVEMPKEIRHPVHPSHPLIQKDWRNAEFTRHPRCSVCDFPHHKLGRLIYICSQGCELFIHLGCAGGFVAADDQTMNHPSHPQHQLRSCPFKCDACGTTEKEKSYICSICQYWIHESCATLPTTPTAFQHHPHHSLSLAFTLPFEYVMYNYACGICSQSLQFTHWVYRCELCRYVVHVKCATNKSHAATSNSIENVATGEERRDILRGPINDIYEELVKPFVKRKTGEILNPHEDNEIFSPYKFHNHNHPLSFTLFSSLSSSHDNKIEENEDEDDDDDNDESPKLTCDGCTMPIHQKKHDPSTSSYDSGYMSCGECKYSLHLACFNLPQQLSSHPLHHIKDHHLELQTSELTHNWPYCHLCGLATNGLFYACTKCYFKIDVKCISLPDTIKHAGHSHFDLKQVIHGDFTYWYCRVGQHSTHGALFYRCDKCKVRVCAKCVLLPASNKHRLENHMLPLTFDASVNHPDDFYCASCEIQMNPKKWMYHCRLCDQSFHPECIPATSGWLRNINFGKKLYHASRHPQHPLRFQLISKKKRCDICHKEAYNKFGYQCTSCNFVVCFKDRDDVNPIE